MRPSSHPDKRMPQNIPDQTQSFHPLSVKESTAFPANRLFLLTQLY